MSNDKQKTYDKHTAQFITVAVQNMPSLPKNQMQLWIEHPKLLQRILEIALSKPYIPEHWSRMHDPSVPLRITNSVKANSFELEGLNIEFSLILKWTQEGFIASIKVSLLGPDENLLDFITIQSEDLIRGFERHLERHGRGLPIKEATLLHRDPMEGLSYYLNEIEFDCGVAAMDLIRDEMVTTLCVEEYGVNWALNLSFGYEGKGSLYLLRFLFSKKGWQEFLAKNTKKENTHA